MCLVSFSKTKDYSSKDKFAKWDRITPIWAYIELTDYCSHECSWCYGDFPSGDKDKSLSVVDYHNILNKLESIGVKQLSIGGGEATEHPDFYGILAATKEHSFSKIHLLTHGDNVPPPEVLLDSGLTSVHFNYQGVKHHQTIHGTDYTDQLESIIRCIDSDLETTATITVGAYNFGDIEEIVLEAKNLGFDRVRFWETTGVGSGFLKGLNTEKIFDHCSEISKKHGYLYSHSYEPEYKKADINVSCIQASNLGMYIDYQGMLKFCGATAKDMFITDTLTNDSKKILSTYVDFNKKFDCNRCEARSPTADIKVATV